MEVGWGEGGEWEAGGQQTWFMSGREGKGQGRMEKAAALETSTDQVHNSLGCRHIRSDSLCKFLFGT